MSNAGEVLDMIQQRQGYVYTSIPAKVLSYDSMNQTIVAEIVIKRPYATKSATEPVIVKDVPVGFYYGGDWVIASPLKGGDAVLLVFPMFDISNWLVGDKGTTYQADGYRFHNIDGAFALPVAFTFNSPTRDSRFMNKFHMVKGNNYLTMDEAGIEIASGSTKVTIDQDGAVTVDTTHCTVNSDMTVNGQLLVTGGLTAQGVGATGSSMKITGNIEIDGDIDSTGSISDSNTNLTTHYHSDPQGGNVSTPI